MFSTEQCPLVPIQGNNKVLHRYTGWIFAIMFSLKNHNRRASAFIRNPFYIRNIKIRKSLFSLPLACIALSHHHRSVHANGFHQRVSTLTVSNLQGGKNQHLSSTRLYKQACSTLISSKHIEIFCCSISFVTRRICIESSWDLAHSVHIKKP